MLLDDGEVKSVDLYDVALKWTATFFAKNLLVESKVVLGSVVVEGTSGNTVLSMDFETDTTDKSIAEQKANLLLTGLKSMLCLFMNKPLVLELSDLKLLNSDDVKNKPALKLISLEPFIKEKLLAPVEFKKENIESIKRIYDLMYPDKLQFLNVTDYQLHYCLLTALHWYSKAMYENVLSDQLVDLWISFNAMYSFIWKKKYGSLSYEMSMANYFIVKSDILSSVECKKILDDHPHVVHEVIPERGQKEYSIKTFGKKEWKKYYNNSYGFDFWEHYDKEQWNEALTEVICYIYGVRNSIFHGNWLPNNSEYLSESISVLNDVINPMLQRLVESLN